MTSGCWSDVTEAEPPEEAADAVVEEGGGDLPRGVLAPLHHRLRPARSGPARRAGRSPTRPGCPRPLSTKQVIRKRSVASRSYSAAPHAELVRRAVLGPATATPPRTRAACAAPSRTSAPADGRPPPPWPRSAQSHWRKTAPGTAPRPRRRPPHRRSRRVRGRARADGVRQGADRRRDHARNAPACARRTREMRYAGASSATGTAGPKTEPRFRRSVPAAGRSVRPRRRLVIEIVGTPGRPHQVRRAHGDLCRSASRAPDLVVGRPCQWWIRSSAPARNVVPRCRPGRAGSPTSRPSRRVPSAGTVPGPEARCAARSRTLQSPHGVGLSRSSAWTAARASPAWSSARDRVTMGWLIPAR